MSYRVLTTESNTPEWLRLRKESGIGASEMAAILGDTNWGSPLTVWQEKTSDEVVDIGTERMEWGHILEASIRDEVGRRYPELGTIVPSEGLLQSVEYPWLIGTLDAQIDSPQYGLVPLEIKNVSAFEEKNWYNRDGFPAVPPKYTVQVRQQAFIKDDAPGGYVGVLFDGNHLEVLWVPRSQDFIDMHLIGTGGEFWNENVLKRITPNPIMGDDLASLWPVDVGEEVEADDLFLEMRERWIDAKGREKGVAEDLETLKFYFGIYFETAEIAVDTDGKKVMKMPARRGSQRVRVDTHNTNHPDCTECVTRDRDSRSPQAIIQKEKTHA